MRVAYDPIRITPNGILAQELSKSLEDELLDKNSDNICTIQEMESDSHLDDIMVDIIEKLKIFRKCIP